MKTLKTFFLVSWLLGICVLNAELNFSNDSSKIILQTDTSEIRINKTGTYDNLALGITNNLNRINFADSTNNVIVLDNDFEIDAGFVFSTSGTLQGNGHSLILTGDLTIPEMTTLKITSSLIIEGNGHTVFIDTFGQLLTDTHATLTLRNLTVKNVVNSSERPALAGSGNSSKITLDTVNLTFNDDFWFNQGSLFFYNNVLYTGRTKFLYCSGQASYIAQNSTLMFDKNSTFFYNPSTANSNLFIAQDPSSIVYFDGSTLQITPTGMNLSDGRFFAENKTTLDVGTEFNSSVFMLNQTNSSLDTKSLDWNLNGQFLAASGQAISGNPDQIKIYQLASTTLTQIGSLQYGGLSSIVYSAAWSPDGQYLAVGGCGAKSGTGGFSDGNSLRIYNFDSETLTFLPITSVDFGVTATISSIDWGGSDDYYIAIGGTGALPVGGFSNSHNLRLYHFDKNKNMLAAITSYNYGTSVNSAKWNFSGVYLAVGGYQGTLSCNLNLLYFDETSSSLILADTKSFGTANETSINSLSWTTDSQFLAIGGGSYINYATSTQNLDIYRFNPANVTPLSLYTFASPVEIASTDHIEIKNVKWSTDNQLLFYGGINPASGNWTSDIYYFNSALDIKLSELKNTSFGTSSKQYAAAWNPATNIFTVGFSNLINLYSLIGLSPKLVSNQNYTTAYSTSAGVYSVAWHPSGTYLSVGGHGANAVGGFSNTDEIRVYRFEGVSESLNALTSQSYGTTVYVTTWNPNGNYLAVGGINPTYLAGGFYNNDHLRIYGFNNTSLSPVISVPLGDSTSELYSIAWHPSGMYVAIGGYNTQDAGSFLAGTNLRIYSFDGANLTPIVGYDFGNVLRTPAGIAWSPDGRYIAVGTCQGRPTSAPTTGNGLTVFEFKNNTSLVQKATFKTSSAMLNVNWEFDDRFIAVNYNDNYNPLSFAILYFTGSSLQEIKNWETYVGALNVNFFNTDVKFSPDGKKIANTSKNGVNNDFGYLSIDDSELKNDNFYTQKISGGFNAWSLAWRPDSKYIALGSFDVTTNAPQIAVFKVENLININRQNLSGLNFGKLVDVNILGSALVNLNGVVNYSAE